MDYATGNGTATAGADYTATSGTLTFDPGETAKTVNVAVLDDAHDDTEDPPGAPPVSVLLATRRPACLAMAVANVARQSYPRLELILALHGPGFGDAAVARAMAGFPHPVTVPRVGVEQPLGAVLAAAAAAGPLLAKMDDDDVYGAEHIWDLVLAREYSGAALVGKFPATVYLVRSDRTVRRRRVRTECWSRTRRWSAPAPAPGPAAARAA